MYWDDILTAFFFVETKRRYLKNQIGKINTIIEEYCQSNKTISIGLIEKMQELYDDVEQKPIVFHHHMKEKDFSYLFGECLKLLVDHRNPTPPQHGLRNVAVPVSIP
jgi:hypothetical protein